MLTMTPSRCPFLFALTVLAAVARGEADSPLISKAEATELLGTMLGGFNVPPLVSLLEDGTLAPAAARAARAGRRPCRA